MPSIYFISGLGADSRAFTKIQEFEGYQNVFLEWIPNLPNESFKHYVARLIKGRNINGDDVVVGLSFGGLAALEVANQTSVKTVVLLSSFKDKSALKPHLQFLLNLRLYNLIPNFKISVFDKQAVKMFGDVSDEAQQGLLDMMQNTNPRFIKWALKQIRKSKYVATPNTKLFNVIGTKDQLLKTWKLPHNNYFINDAGHLMVFDNADNINQVLKNILNAQ